MYIRYDTYQRNGRSEFGVSPAPGWCVCCTWWWYSRGEWDEVDVWLASVERRRRRCLPPPRCWRRPTTGSRVAAARCRGAGDCTVTTRAATAAETRRTSSALRDVAERSSHASRTAVSSTQQNSRQVSLEQAMLRLLRTVRYDLNLVYRVSYGLNVRRNSRRSMLHVIERVRKLHGSVLICTRVVVIAVACCFSSIFPIMLLVNKDVYKTTWFLCTAATDWHLFPATINLIIIDSVWISFLSRVRMLSYTQSTYSNFVRIPFCLKLSHIVSKQEDLPPNLLHRLRGSSIISAVSELTAVVKQWQVLHLTTTLERWWIEICRFTELIAAHYWTCECDQHSSVT